MPANIVGEKRQLRGLLEDEIIREEGGKYYLVLKREEANIYKAGEQTSINWVFVSMIVLVNLAFIVFLIAVKKAWETGMNKKTSSACGGCFLINDS